MGTKHVHANEIKAWADGEVIQFWSPNKLEWFDTVDNVPMWEQNVKYRVKPKNIVVKRSVQYDLYTECVRDYNHPPLPNVRYEFTEEGKLVSVELIK